MDWYTKRKTVILGIFILILVLIFGYLLKDVISPAPTCADGKKNGIELGVDCGGGCLLVCATEYKPLTVSLAKAIKTTDGMYDILVLIDNANESSAPTMLSVVVDLYDSKGKNFKSLRSTSPAFSGSQIPVFNQNYQADDIANVVAHIEPYEMYRAFGGYTMQLKRFTYIKKEKSTDLDIFYTSPYRQDIEEQFVAMVVSYNSLGNVVGFTQTTIDGLDADKTSEVFVSLPYRVEGDIASVRFIPLNMMYAKE